jgi:hypothetical protein
MTLETPDTPETDPHVADAIARAEEGRAMLQRLAKIGMVLAEEIDRKTNSADPPPEPKRDRCRAYAAVARAVQRSVAMVVWLDADILAMRKGESIKVRPAREVKPAPQVSAPQHAWTPPAEPAQPSPLQAKVRSSVWGAINQEVRDIYRAQDVLDRLHDSLIEREDYDAFLNRPFRECVAAICADLGLSPDWSRWSDESGFPVTKNENGPHKNWPRFWQYNPARAAERRRLRSADVPSASLGGQVADETSALPPEPHRRQ